MQIITLYIGFFYYKTLENIDYHRYYVDKELRESSDNFKDLQCIKNPAKRLHF